MIQRTILKKITPWLYKRKIIILKGARRVGKTTLLKTLEKEVKVQKAFLSCDNLDFLSKIKTSDDLIFYLREFHDFSEKKDFFLFLDDFQYLKQAGLFLKSLHERFLNLHIAVSSSSSFEVTRNSESLSGNSVEFFVSTVSFYEFFQHQCQKEITKKSIDDLGELSEFYLYYKEKLKSTFKNYLSWGGYPELLMAKSEKKKEKLLEEYRERYLEKDVINFLKVENVSGFNNLLAFLADNIGRLVNTSEISNALNISHQTVKKYLKILKGTYVVNILAPFYKNSRSELSKMPKVFFNDLGFRNSILGVNKSIFKKIDLDFEVENFVFKFLQHNFQKRQIHFYRTIAGSEIDFLVEREVNKYLLIEVKYRNKVRKPLAFKNFSRKYPEASMTSLVVTKDLLKKEGGVYYLPACLLGFVK